MALTLDYVVGQNYFPESLQKGFFLPTFNSNQLYLLPLEIERERERLSRSDFHTEMMAFNTRNNKHIMGEVAAAELLSLASHEQESGIFI